MKALSAYLPVALLSTILIGCSSPKPVWVSNQQRSETFHGYEDVQIDGQPICDFAKQRSAVLVTGFPASVAQEGERHLTLQLAPDAGGSGDVHGALAAAIESDGYFLTAAHIMDNPVTYLVYFDGQRTKAAVPRVVARISNSASKLDFAVIHVSDSISNVFEMADFTSRPPDDRIKSVGSSLSVLNTSWSVFRLACLAGRAQKVRKTDSGAAIVLSDLPARNGDSGGPVVDESGRLVGIHSGVSISWLGTQTAVATRPDPTWLARVIEQDRRTRGSNSTERLDRSRASPSSPAVMIIFD